MPPASTQELDALRSEQQTGLELEQGLELVRTG
jgi:hypothetical protein